MTWKSRIAALLLALCCLTAALTGCGKKQTDTAAPIDQPTQTQTAPEPVDDYKQCCRRGQGSASPSKQATGATDPSAARRIYPTVHC